MLKSRKIISLLLVLLLTVSMGSTVYGSDGFRKDGITVEEMARVLDNLRILEGNNKGYELEKELTRAEGATIVVRLYGEIDGAYKNFDENTKNNKFIDVPDWAKKWVYHLNSKDVINGISDTKFGSNEKMDANQFITMILRVLGYDDSKGDFLWNKSLDKALEIGLVDKEQKSKLESKFNREGMVIVVYNALFCDVVGENKNLIKSIAGKTLLVNPLKVFSFEMTDDEKEEINNDRFFTSVFEDQPDKQIKLENKFIELVNQGLSLYNIKYKDEVYSMKGKEVIAVSEPHFGGRQISVYFKTEAKGDKGTLKDVLISVTLTIDDEIVTIASIRKLKMSMAEGLMSGWLDKIEFNNLNLKNNVRVRYNEEAFGDYEIDEIPNEIRLTLFKGAFEHSKKIGNAILLVNGMDETCELKDANDDWETVIND